MENTHSNKTQHDKFKETAKELGCDGDEARFNKKLKRVVNLRKVKDKENNRGYNA